MGVELKNKPLVEAIFEIRWPLEEKSPGITSDPYHKRMLGRLLDRLSEKFPAYEEVGPPVPEEFLGSVIRHRFRSSANGWPLVQLGPGVLSVNDTRGYTWAGFRSLVEFVVETFLNAHPAPAEFKPKRLLLRYIDAVDFDWETENPREFLQNKFGIGIGFREEIFATAGLSDHARILRLLHSASCRRPAGVFDFMISTGHREKIPAIIWETALTSEGVVLSNPTRADPYMNWIDEAHDVSDKWFFQLIQGDLRSQFDAEPAV